MFRSMRGLWPCSIELHLSIHTGTRTESLQHKKSVDGTIIVDRILSILGVTIINST